MSDDSYDWNKHWSVYDANTQNNPAQLFRFRVVADLVSQLPGSRLVDIGCGQGDLLRHLATTFPALSLAGFELSQSGVDATKQKVPTAEVQVLDLYSAQAPGILSQVHAEIGTCSEVLEHVPDPVSFLSRARTALLPGGFMVATVPGGPRTGFDIQIGHLQHFTRSSIQSIFEQAGYEVVNVYGAGFPFFNVYKLAVMSRGQKVAEDYEGRTTIVFRAALKVFGFLFNLSRVKSRFGWQLVVVARVRDA